MRGSERFAESPFVGGGAGALADLTAGRISSAHNTFLTIMSEQGLLGFVPMAGFFALVIISLYRKNRLYMFHGDRQMAGLSAGLLSALVALLGAVQFYDALYSFDPNWILLSLAVACVISPMHVVRNKTLLPRR